MSIPLSQPLIPDHEAERLRAFHQYFPQKGQVSDTLASVAHLVAHQFQTPIVLISLVAEQEVVFGANVGLPGLNRMDRALCPCSWTILSPEPTVLEDTRRQSSLPGSLFVLGDTDIRFYAGAPLLTPEGYALGTVCISDTRPRAFSDVDRHLLTRYADLIMNGLNQQLALRQQQEQEQQFERIFQTTSDAILILDADGQITEANPAACRLYGYARPELLHRPCGALIHPDSYPTFRDLLGAGQEAGPFETESTHLRQDGRRIQVSVKGHPLVCSGQRCTLLTVTDVGLQRDAEVALRQTQLLLQTALSAGLVATWLWEVTTNVVYADSNLAHLFGVSEQQINAGLPLDRFINAIHPDDRARVQQQLQRARTDRAEYETDYRVLSASGELRWVVARGRITNNNQRGADVLLGVLVDITDRKQAELRFQESEERLQLAIDAASLGTWDYNLVTGEVQWSRTCKTLFGLAPDGPVSSAILLERVHPDDRDRVGAANRRILSPESDGNHDEIFRTIDDDGHQRWVRAKGKIFRDEQGRMVRFSGIVLDITELKLSQEALRKSAGELELRVAERTQALYEANQQLKKTNQSLTEFAYVASHDLQEPLRKIQAFGDILHDSYAGRLDDEGRDILRRMQASAGRMSGLIRDLLTYSRLSTNTVQKAPVPLSDVVAGVADDLELAIQDAGATLEVAPLPTVLGDESQLRQLFQNLLSNALKFRRTDVAAVIRVNTWAVAAADLPGAILPGRQVAHYQCIRVADNGIGFDDKYNKRIFQVFQRLHGKSQYAGTGIGLAVCHKVVANHGGAITAISQPGQGAAFDVYLPIETTPSAPRR